MNGFETFDISAWSADGLVVAPPVRRAPKRNRRVTSPRSWMSRVAIPVLTTFATLTIQSNLANAAVSKADFRLQELYHSVMEARGAPNAGVSELVGASVRYLKGMDIFPIDPATDAMVDRLVQARLAHVKSKPIK